MSNTRKYQAMIVLKKTKRDLCHMCCRGLYGLLYQKISIVLIFFWAAHQRMLGSYKYTWAHSGSSVISRWRTHVSTSASLPHGRVTRFGLLPYIYWDSNVCASRLRFWGSIGLDVSWLWNNVGCVFVLAQWLNGLEGCMFHLQWLEADWVVWLQELCLWEKMVCHSLSWRYWCTCFTSLLCWRSMLSSTMLGA